jgi:hypothetical protein
MQHKTRNKCAGAEKVALTKRSYHGCTNEQENKSATDPACELSEVMGS